MSFKQILLVVFSIFIGSCASVGQYKIEAETPTVIDKAMDSTVAFVVNSPRDESLMPYCAGVWINQDTLLTALHCAQGAATMEKIRELPPNVRPFGFLFIEEVKDPTGVEMLYTVSSEVTGIDMPPTAIHKSKVVNIDSKHDLALLKAERKEIPMHSWLRVSNTVPKVGDKVYIIGHPGGLYFTFMDGKVAAIRETFPIDWEDDDFNVEGPFIQIFSAIYKGNSGGPVISESGELIGIVSFIARAPNQGFAIAPISIKKFIMDSYSQRILK